MRKFFLTVYMVIMFVPLALAKEGLVPLSFEAVNTGDSFQASGRQIDLWGIVAPNEGHMLYLTAQLYLETLLTAGALECELKGEGAYRCNVDGKDVAADLVLFGLAEDEIGVYKLEEAEAKRNKRGLWQSPISDEL